MKTDFRLSSEKNTSARIKTSRLLDRLFFAASLALTPLVIRNGYLDITETKTLFFVFIAVIYLLGRTVLFLQYREKEEKPHMPFQISDAAALCFCLISFMASLSSGFFRESFLGVRGRWQGTAMFFLYALLFYAFSRRRILIKDILLPLFIGLGSSSLLAVLNHLGFDPLGIVTQLSNFDRERYISTLGNINFAGAYLCLTLPAAVIHFLYSEKSSQRAILSALCVLGLWAAMAVRSECVVLGLGAAAVLMPFLLRNEPDALRRWGLLLPGTVLAMQLYRGVVLLSGGWFSSLTTLLFHPVISAATSVFGLSWYFALRGKKGREVFFLKFYRISLGSLMIAAAAGLVLVNTVWKEIDLGRLEQWLRFSDAWGTDRVGVWRHCLGFYKGFGIWEKIFGGGCGIIAFMDTRERLFPDAILDAAHCEYLQILLNWGALGLTAYLCWIICTVRDALRQDGELSVVLCTGLIAYAIQAAVNIAQSPGIMMFFLLLAAARGRTDERNVKKDEK